MHTSSTAAQQVSNIQTNPASPAYNQIFECVITVDENDQNLACDLMPLDAPNSETPWDLCPKNNNGSTGFKYYAGGQRHYQCRALTQKGIPGPGNYRIVAWHFYGDGYTGDVLYSKPITLLADIPPSHTPIPPTKTPTPQPTLPQPTIPPPTLKVGYPTITHPVVPSATSYFLVPTNSPVPTNIPTKNQPPPIQSPFTPINTPTPTIRGNNPFNATPPPIWDPFENFPNIEKKVLQGVADAAGKSKSFVINGKNFIVEIINNFLREGNF